jgi:hypothetical protein
MTSSSLAALAVAGNSIATTAAAAMHLPHLDMPVLRKAAHMIPTHTSNRPAALGN